MSSFLYKKRTQEDYLQKISSEPTGTQRNKLGSIRNFERFVETKYGGRSVDKVIQELSFLKDIKREQALYDMLQGWINWNHDEGKNNSTIRTMFSYLRQYFYYRGIKTNPQDIKENLKFGKKLENERHPLSLQEYRDVVNGFSKHPKRQALYLALGSSGMRMGEALKLRKKDLDFSQDRIKVNMRAENTKTRKARSSYISKEAENRLKPILDKLSPDDLIFTKEYPDPLNASIVEQKVFNALLKRLGFDDRYSSNNHRKITSHSFRSWFFTKAARKQGEDYAHKMTGHGGYMIQYDRMTGEEKGVIVRGIYPEPEVKEQAYTGKNLVDLDIISRASDQLGFGDIENVCNKVVESELMQEGKGFQEFLEQRERGVTRDVFTVDIDTNRFLAWINKQRNSSRDIQQEVDRFYQDYAIFSRRSAPNTELNPVAEGAAREFDSLNIRHNVNTSHDDNAWEVGEENTIEYEVRNLSESNSFFITKMLITVNGAGYSNKEFPGITQGLLAGATGKGSISLKLQKKEDLQIEYSVTGYFQLKGIDVTSDKAAQVKGTIVKIIEIEINEKSLEEKNQKSKESKKKPKK